MLNKSKKTVHNNPSNPAPGSAKELVIPAALNGLPVTKIGNDAFFGCISLTTVTIPLSVTKIGERVFYGCNFDQATRSEIIRRFSNGAFGGRQW